MKHRKLFVCLTALLLVSVFAVNALGATKSEDAGIYGTVTGIITQRSDKNYLDAKVSVECNHDQAQLRITVDFTDGFENTYHSDVSTGPRGKLAYSHTFPVYRLVEYTLRYTISAHEVLKGTVSPTGFYTTIVLPVS